MITRFKLYDEYKELEKKVSDKKDEILKLVDKFINLNKDKWSKWDIEEYYKCIGVDLNYKREWVDIAFYQDKEEEEEGEDGWSTRLSFGDFRNFLSFMADPDFYISTKKFNL